MQYQHAKSVIFHLLLTPPPDLSHQKEGRKLPKGYHMFLWVLKPIKNDLVSSWDGMTQLSQTTVMFVVNLKKSFQVIVEPEKTEQNRPDRQMY